eukprot:jgi/Mesvir1/25172/Mv18852-RA.1
MASAIMQLHARGSQDIATIVNPEVTFWKTVYPRHTNFAWDDTFITQSTGLSDYGQLIEFKLPRSGDLSYVENMPVEHGGSIRFNSDNTVKEQYKNTNPQFLYIPLEFSFTQDPGLALPMISLQYHEVRVKVKLAAADKIFNYYKALNTRTYNTSLPTYTTDHTAIRAVLQGCFYRGIYGNEMSQMIQQLGHMKYVNWVIEYAMFADKVGTVTWDTTAGIAFSLTGTGDTLIPNSLKFHIHPAVIPDDLLKTLDSQSYTPNARTTWLTDPPKIAVRLMCRYIYLDDFERRQFAVNTHEYLMTEYQHHQQFVADVDQVSIDLKFNHPTKELIFFYRPDKWWEYSEETDAVQQYKGYWNFVNPVSEFGGGHLFSTANLVLNSQNVYGDGRDPVYFHYLVQHQFHERVSPGVMLYTIPLCIQPDAWKPSGSLNLSRLDDVKLVLKKMGGLPPGSIHVYAKSYNVIKIQNGMGGKRYAS